MVAAMHAPMVRIPIPSSYAPTTQSSPDPCACAKTFNLQCEQGATLSSRILLKLDGQPIDITGATFQFTAKLDPSDADNAPTTVKVDWQEVVTPTQGYTWLVVQAAITLNMQIVAYSYQVRMVSGTGVVTPIVKGAFTIVQPVSSRGAPAFPR